mgnify:CR=1 FL=1|jgi:Predicted membrane protein
MVNSVNAFCQREVNASPISREECAGKSNSKVSSKGACCAKIIGVALAVLGLALAIGGAVLLGVGSLSCLLPVFVPIAMIAVGVVLLGLGSINACLSFPRTVKVADKLGNQQIRILRNRVCQLENQAVASRARLAALEDELTEQQYITSAFQTALEAGEDGVPCGKMTAKMKMDAANSEILCRMREITLMGQALNQALDRIQLLRNQLRTSSRYIVGSVEECTPLLDAEETCCSLDSIC